MGDVKCILLASLINFQNNKKHLTVKCILKLNMQASELVKNSNIHKEYTFYKNTIKPGRLFSKSTKLEMKVNNIYTSLRQMY